LLTQSKIIEPGRAYPGFWGISSWRICAVFAGTPRGMVTFVIVLIIVGLIAGAIARLLVPGRDPMGILATIALGVVGSFIGGFLENLVQYHTLSVNNFHPAGLIGSIIGAIVLLLLLRLTGRERRRRYYRSRV
jgi:uncharacterized membrane protein YeaQ/YmgE (transglycosylase-associated protein family)